ncbi:MAG: hypothetical protein ABII12_12360 [Planctomycetota bacterium]
MDLDALQSIFIRPMQITGISRLAMLAPLLLSVSIVYKTIRCRRLAAIPLASLLLSVVLVGGMMALGVVLLIIFLLLA